jgi:ethanolamine utilization protein EutQ
MEIVETVDATYRTGTGAPRKNAATAQCSGEDLAKIKAEVQSRLPAGAVSGEVIEQLVRKLAAESAVGAKPAAAKPATPSAPQEAAFDAQLIKSGIKKITGSSVRFGLFDGAGRENQVGIADVVTADDGSSMAAGYMGWKNCFFPWTLTYDEVDYVIEGELHIRCGGETVVGKAGDVIFIPKNTAIEFGTTSEVRFLYVAYPANWQDIK